MEKAMTNLWRGPLINGMPAVSFRDLKIEHYLSHWLQCQISSQEILAFYCSSQIYFLNSAYQKGYSSKE